jgi:hypothetical protein
MTELRAKLVPFLALSVAAVILAGCAGGASWYDSYCQRKGYRPGTAGFDQCKMDAKRWIDWTQWRNDEIRSSSELQ